MASSTATGISPTRSNQAVAQQPRKKKHPFIASGLFDIISKVKTEVNGQYGFRESMTTIATIDLDTDKVLECAIKASAYGGIDTVLDTGSIYCLKGRVLALNKKEMQVEKVTPEKENVTIIMRHSDFNPSPSVGTFLTSLNILYTRLTDGQTKVRDQETFDVEYCCNWSPLMVKLHQEALLTGRIIGFSPMRSIWSVEVTGVNITTGHESGTTSLLPAPGIHLGTPGGQVRGKLFIPGGDEDDGPVQPPLLAVQPKGRTATSSPNHCQVSKKARGNVTAEDALIDP
ncbi:hypothetical protein DFH28DRAFT_1125583 [Melampsora americana]|nr:hypothetical protein DFH28DRAFT_1125583 [Melampsora americana]